MFCHLRELLVFYTNTQYTLTPRHKKGNDFQPLILTDLNKINFVIPKWRTSGLYIKICILTDKVRKCGKSRSNCTASSY